VDHSPAFLRIVDEARARIREVSIDDVERLHARRASFILIDVREGEEWARGHLPGARHLCKGIIERDIETTVPDRNAHLVLYCGGGFRSALAAEALQRMGYTRAESMAGGWRAWTEAGKAVDPRPGLGSDPDGEKKAR
jgi:rhodanese-related sulfurtransferase